MTTFKSHSPTTVTKKFISIKEESQSEINQFRNFSKKNLSEHKTFIGGILASKSNKQNKKDLVASDNFYSNSILSLKKQQTKETPTQSAEPSTEKEQPVEETKETPTQSAEPSTEKEQPVEETKETPTQSAEPSTEKEQPVEETKETPTQS
ncbi:MAG: hypothetical protein EVA26_03570, partial [Burkholderiaceae bacterium]